MNRRAFLFAIPILAVFRSMGGDHELLRRCKVRALTAFLDFGKGAHAVLHGQEAILAKIPPCDVCGLRMTNWKGWTVARDVHDIGPINGQEAYNLGALHVGCPAHPAKSITYMRRAI